MDLGSEKHVIIPLIGRKERLMPMAKAVIIGIFIICLVGIILPSTSWMAIVASATFVAMLFATMFDDFRDRLRKSDHPIGLQLISLVTWKAYFSALFLGKQCNFILDGHAINLSRKELTIRN